MPEDDLDLGGLDRLAPGVDTAAARRVFDRRRRRQGRARLAARVAMVVAAVGLVGGILALRPDSEDGGPATSSTAPAGTVRTITTSTDGVELSIAVAESAVVGTRLPVTITIRNASDAPFWWQSGGCAIPAVVTLVPASSPLPSPASTDDVAVPSLPEADWVPGETELAEALAAGADEWAAPYQTAAMTGWREIACTADLRYSVVEPGGTLDQPGSFELRVPEGALPSDGDLAVQAELRVLPEDPTLGLEPSSDALEETEVVGRAPVALLDDEARTGADAAVAAFQGDPRLAAYVTETSDLRGDVTQSYAVTMTWWRDEWELWVRPTYSEQDRRDLRMRYDPATGEVTDVRTVQHQKAADDEPDAVPLGIDAPDEVR